jgi:hypothetical protein
VTAGHVTPKGVPSAVRMRNRKLWVPAIFSVEVIACACAIATFGTTAIVLTFFNFYFIAIFSFTFVIFSKIFGGSDRVRMRNRYTLYYHYSINLFFIYFFFHNTYMHV